jgi:nitrate/nitrite transport system substrate-binding protein
MSTFDDPFDADRKLSRSSCICGQHRSADEHDQAALTLRCEPVPSDEKRYEGVVASAVMRAVFPKDAARRAFLKSVGASPPSLNFSRFRPRPRFSRKAARRRKWI